MKLVGSISQQEDAAVPDHLRRDEKAGIEI